MNTFIQYERSEHLVEIVRMFTFNKYQDTANRFTH